MCTINQHSPIVGNHAIVPLRMHGGQVLERGWYGYPTKSDAVYVISLSRKDGLLLIAINTGCKTLRS
jgi:hypothetical protein